MLQITESAMRSLLVKLGYKTAASWTQRKLQSRLNTLPDLRDDLETDDLDSVQSKLLAQIFRSYKKEVPALIVGDEDDHPKFLKGDFVVHGHGGVYKVVKPPYLVSADICINAVEINSDGKSMGNIEQMFANDFTRNATKEDLVSPQKKTKAPIKSEQKKVITKKKGVSTKKIITKNAEKKPFVSIGKTIDTLFDKTGVEKVQFPEALKAAKSIKPETAFNEAQLYWYKNRYRNEHGLPAPPRKNAKGSRKDIRAELKKRLDAKKSKAKAQRKVAKKTTKKVAKKGTKKTAGK